MKNLFALNKIAKLPEQKLSEVDSFIQKIFLQLKFEKPKPENLKGIWKNKGFEKLADLDAEIKQIRNELNESIERKVL